MKKYLLSTTFLFFLYLFIFSNHVQAVPLVDLPAEVKNILSEDMLMAIDRPYALVNGNYVPLDENNSKVKPYIYKSMNTGYTAYMIPLKAAAKYAGVSYHQTADEVIVDNIHLKIKDNKVTGVSGTDFIFEDEYANMQFKDGEFYVVSGMIGKLFTSDGFSPSFQVVNQNSINGLIHISRDSGYNNTLYLQEHDSELFDYMISLPTKRKFSDSIVILQNGPYARAFDKEVKLDNNNLNVKPITRKSRMLVPAKFFAENFNARIHWDGKNRTAFIITDTKQIQITANKNYIIVNGKQQAIEVPAELYQDRMYLPLKVISELFGQKIYYTKGIAVLSSTSITPDFLSSEEVSIFNRYFNGRRDNDLDQVYQNSPNNSSAVKHVVKRGEWTYYIDYGYNAKYNFNGLWRIHDNGKTRQKLVDGRVDYIDVVGDWIYFYNDKGCYKLRTDGTSLTKLSVQDYHIHKQYIRNGLIYYFDWMGNYFYSYTLDGTAAAGSKILSNSKITQENMVGNNIFYINRDDGDTLYQLNIETGINRKITNSKVDGFAVIDDYVYFSRGFNIPGIFRLQLNDRNTVLENNPHEQMIYVMQNIHEEKISDDKAGSINAYKGWVYYYNPDDGDKLYKVSIDGTAKTRLNNQASYNLNIIGDWIYYRSDGKLFRVKANGTGITRLNPDTLGLSPYDIGPPVDVPPVSGNAITLEQKDQFCNITKPVGNPRIPDVSISLVNRTNDKAIEFSTYNMRDPKVLIKVTFLLENGTKKEFLLKNPDNDGIAAGIYNYSKDVFTGEIIRVEVSWTAYGQKGNAATTFKSVI